VSAPPSLPRDALDVMRMPWHQALAYSVGVRLMRGSGLWRYPAKASGALERMRFVDKLYWFSKAREPVRRAVRGSGLERFFAAQRSHVWRLPEGFAKSATVALSAAGDLMNHPFLAASSEVLYRDVEALLFDVDLATANLECVVQHSARGELTFDMRSGPPLYMEPDTFDVVAGRRKPGARRPFEVLATACNHTLDYGPEGVDSTIETLRSRDVAFAGINACEGDASHATLVERNGIRLAFVAFTFGLNAHAPPVTRPSIVNVARLDERPERADLAQLEAQLAHARREGADFVIAHLHWGMEYELYPRPEQLELAHHLAERGVDAILGHHPHVLQPSEHYRTRRDPDRVVPIFYSLGNLTNPFSAEHIRRSGVARLELSKGKRADGSERTYVERAELHEVSQHVDPVARTISVRPA
jgi:poly-gamma-glutamate synthesis protein (capsule biosynthesis protein)